jgi:hypothetical protein
MPDHKSVLIVRLKTSTIAIRQRTDGSRSSLLIPAGAEVFVKDATALRGSSNDPTEIVSVQWEGTELAIFLADLVERAYWESTT